MKKKYIVKHNFLWGGQYTEAGKVIEAVPKEVRYLVLGGQIEECLNLPEEKLAEEAKRARKKGK